MDKGFIRIHPPTARVYCDGELVVRDANEYEVRLLMLNIQLGKVQGNWEVEFEEKKVEIDKNGRIKLLPSGFLDANWVLVKTRWDVEISEEDQKVIDPPSRFYPRRKYMKKWLDDLINALNALDVNLSIAKKPYYLAVPSQEKALDAAGVCVETLKKGLREQTHAMCKNCKFFETGFERFGIDEDKPPKNLGRCLHGHINIHPNYYTESEEITPKDGMETTYTPYFAEDFGCIHFEQGQFIIT